MGRDACRWVARPPPGRDGGATSDLPGTMTNATAAVLTLPPLSPQPALRVLPGGFSEATAALERAEALVERHHYAEALDAVGEIHVPAGSAPDLALRTLHVESWARMSLGELDAAETTVERARELSEGASFTDLDRAETLFRLGCVRQRSAGSRTPSPSSRMHSASPIAPVALAARCAPAPTSGVPAPTSSNATGKRRRATRRVRTSMRSPQATSTAPRTPFSRARLSLSVAATR